MLFGSSAPEYATKHTTHLKPLHVTEDNDRTSCSSCDVALAGLFRALWNGRAFHPDSDRKTQFCRQGVELFRSSYRSAVRGWDQQLSARLVDFNNREIPLARVVRFSFARSELVYSSSHNCTFDQVSSIEQLCPRAYFSSRLRLAEAIRINDLCQPFTATNLL